MFEHCRHYRCVYADEKKFCRILNSACRKQLDERQRCVHSGLFLKCPFACYDGDILRCGYDTENTKRYVPGLPSWKYERKLAVDDLPECLIEIKKRKKGGR
jgi:hypothetical protein